MDAKNIALIRKCKGITQQELADRIGRTRQQVSAIETGQSTPSVKTAKAIAKELGINWTSLFSSNDLSISEKGDESHDE